MLGRTRLSLGAVLVSLVTLPAWAVVFEPRLINGIPVQPGEYENVVKIRAEGAGCTATVVGPRVIVTAAHCARTGASAEFTVKGKTYSATVTRSPLYPQQDHDVALAVTSSDITGVDYATIGGKAQVGLTLTLLGYGCKEIGGEDEPDGLLRKGDTVVKSFTTYDMESSKPNGAALCFGDSGGPAFVQDAGKQVLLGINSKGNIQDTNYNARLDLDVSTQFLKKFATDKAVEICGVNKNCTGGPVDPPPTCTLAAQPNSIKLGQSLSLNFSASGAATGATVDGSPISVPTGQRLVTPSSKGNFTAQAIVFGPGGQGTCSANYSVTDDPLPMAPTCTISVAPTAIKLGATVTASMATQGQVTSASIDGIFVGPTGGKVQITPTVTGWHSVTGIVVGPGGQSSCKATYSVDNGTPPPPPPPTGTFTVVPLACGINSVLETPVREVCMATVQYKQVNRDITIKDVVLITFSDGSQEVLPVLAKRTLPPSPGDAQVYEELTSYANGLKWISSTIVMDTRKLTLVTMPGVELPVSLEGRSSNGQYFLVDRFKKLTSRKVHLLR